MSSIPECSAETEPCPHHHTCGISGWPAPPPRGADRLYPAPPSLPGYLHIYTDPRLHGTWTKTHKDADVLTTVASKRGQPVSPLEHDGLAELLAELGCGRRVGGALEEGVCAQRDVVGFTARCLTG